MLFLPSNPAQMRKRTYSKSSGAINKDNPVRLAFLGGPRAGKTALISKLTSGSYSDTYYPLRQANPVLFNYVASQDASKTVMDQTRGADAMQALLKRDNVLVSPVIYQALQNGYKTTQTGEPGPVSAANAIYASYSENSDGNTVSGVTPVLTELIDTPAFNPSQVVPFLEVSLYMKLDKDVLHKLADIPRQPVSTNPLLVASGAGEMNGSVDGYFLVYNAIPSVDPPAYENTDTSSDASTSSCESGCSYNEDGTLKHVTMHSSAHDESFSLLPIIKDALDEAWKEYYTYKTRWQLGEEHDVFLIKSALRNMWSARSATPKRTDTIDLMDTSVDPASPLCPPPVWIVCTNAKSPLASPKLILDGKKLAQLWRCGFMAVDASENVDDVLSLMIRELAERRNLRRRRRSWDR